MKLIKENVYLDLGSERVKSFLVTDRSFCGSLNRSSFSAEIIQ